MALPYGTTGSLRPTFVPARLVGLAVKLPSAFALYGWFPISLRNLRAPPLLFWRRPPQSNYPPDNVQDPDHGPLLELQYAKGGISPVAPPTLARRLQSLPPILHIAHRGSLPGCSKGAQGLSVYVRVTGIFTGATDSLSPLQRQLPDRYAIRAGRNLPDKEFRYLRTVIVTAAVYRGFDSELRLAANPSS